MGVSSGKLPKGTEINVFFRTSSDDEAVDGIEDMWMYTTGDQQPTASPTLSDPTSSPRPTTSLSPTSSPTSCSNYIGCFIDNEDRDLPDNGEGDQHGIESCRERCSSEGYKYAGLQYYDECFCGNSYGTYGETAESDCNKSCRVGDGICGGSWRNSVYRSSNCSTSPPTTSSPTTSSPSTSSSPTTSSPSTSSSPTSSPTTSSAPTTSSP